jgi:hypothetical protein
MEALKAANHGLTTYVVTLPVQQDTTLLIRTMPLQHSKIKNDIAYIAALHAVNQKKFVVPRSRFIQDVIAHMPSRNGQLRVLVIL